ncbi:hypothetical protein GCM10022237_25090 [Nocardioides ginsengisoli]|uniref:Uncharacterized protein n=1 Tax=Nocardioides ginsengisoli TaxID=363868 RepID=A0ABW3W6X0_9ACTN
MHEHRVTTARTTTRQDSRLECDRAFSLEHSSAGLAKLHADVEASDLDPVADQLPELRPPSQGVNYSCLVGARG